MKDRRYVILRKYLGTGEICGYCENSFSMSFEKNRVKVYGCVLKTGDKTAQDNYQNYIYQKYNGQKRYKGVRNANSPNQKLWYELRKTVNSLREEDKGNKYEYKVFRLGKRCPIEVDFTEYNMMKSRKMKYDKYLWRNQPILAVNPEKW